MSVTVKVVVPEGALSVLRVTPDEFGEQLKRAAVAKWYELGTVSQSKAAEILGVSSSELLGILSAYRVSPYQVDEEDLASEASRG
jgi:predicted HTH domain antitoxin